MTKTKRIYNEQTIKMSIARFAARTGKTIVAALLNSELRNKSNEKLLFSYANATWNLYRRQYSMNGGNMYLKNREH